MGRATADPDFTLFGDDVRAIHLCAAIAGRVLRGNRFSYSAVIRLNAPSAFMPSSASASFVTIFRSVWGLQARKSGCSLATKTTLMSVTFAALAASRPE